MRKFLLGLFILTGLSGFSQTNVILNLEHLINGEPFDWTTVATNNLGDEFSYNRLEYYLSGFRITHDGGTVTSFLDVYALVQGDESPSINIGSINAENIEMINFQVGVDQANNHGDPASWPSSHPLAPKFPSMHWGWVAGYRFVAAEGDILATSQQFSIHGLGDINYFQVDLDLDIQVTGDETNIYVQASTENLLYDMSLSGTVFSHGEDGLAQQTLLNMYQHVFEVATVPLSANGEQELVKFNLFPNPADNGLVQLNFSDDAEDTYQLVLRDIQGKTVLQRSGVNSGYQLDVNQLNEGLYLVSLYNSSSLRGVRKLVVRK